MKTPRQRPRQQGLTALQLAQLLRQDSVKQLQAVPATDKPSLQARLNRLDAIIRLLLTAKNR
ncbi:MAG: hypothetical protein ACOCZE_03450 [Planctomycetota bacterium]